MGSVVSLVVSVINFLLWPLKTFVNWCLDIYVCVVRFLTTVVLFFLLAPYRLLPRNSHNAQLQSKLSQLQTQLDELSASSRALQSKLDAAEIDKWRTKEKFQKVLSQRNQLKDRLIESNKKVLALEQVLSKTEKEVNDLRASLAETRTENSVVRKYLENLVIVPPLQDRSTKPEADPASSLEKCRNTEQEVAQQAGCNARVGTTSVNAPPISDIHNAKQLQIPTPRADLEFQIFLAFTLCLLMVLSGVQLLGTLEWRNAMIWAPASFTTLLWLTTPKGMKQDLRTKVVRPLRALNSFLLGVLATLWFLKIQLGPFGFAVQEFFEFGGI